MNSNRGIDPMLSSLVGDSMWNTKIIAEPVPGSFEQLILPGERMVSPVPDVLLSPESNPPYSDLEFLWGNERKRVTSIKMEEDDTFSSSPCSTEEVDSSEIENMDMEECDIKSEINVVGEDGHDADIDMPLHGSNVRSYLCDSESNTPKYFNMSDVGARKYVDSLFSKIAFVPNPNSTHNEKIQYILSLSDCKDYKLDDILNLDKRSSESARVCAKIVQNIPQRYRWECVKPEEIPCCYTIVADCKKLSNRDKPPRPMNAFMIWAQGARRLINELCPKMQNAAISEALGYYWRQKSDLFKKRFEMEKIKLRRFHNIEFPQYKYKPKTKIQKAKEKKELSMSKCKVSKSAVQREKLEETDSNIPPRRKSKYGRPRKAKQIYEPEPTGISKLTSSKCDEITKSSPTKPAIKDMLTLKILNDRRSKGMTPVNCNDRVQSCLGQLSPLEIENPATGDVFDELRDYEPQMGSCDLQTAADSSNRFRSISSSVYDTPANTPPIDENDHPLSPIQTPSSSSSSIPSIRSPVPCQLKVDLPTSSSTSHLSPRESMPSLKAILSSGTSLTRRSPSFRRDVFTSGPVSSVQTNCHIRKESDEARSGLSTDLMLSYVSEILTSPTCGGKSKGCKDNNNNQGNVCDVNNNNCSWQYNSCGETNPNAGNDAFRPKSPVNYTPTLLDFSDLDTLSLDLNVPLLSDDVMKSLLNSL